MTDALRLLFVEDDPDFSLLIRRLLERAGHSVASCRCAAEALSRLRQGNYDLALLNRDLPDMTVPELLQTMASEGITTPAIMVYPLASAWEADVVGFVVKGPSTRPLIELSQRVQEAVARHRR
jgi:CheY-like chemotaxis protein